MLKLFYNGKMIMKGNLDSLLSLLHQFMGAEMKTTDKINYYLTINN